jgi:hypothetical protein
MRLGEWKSINCSPASLTGPELTNTEIPQLTVK